MSVSPDLSRIVTSGYIPGPSSTVLEIYDVSTGRCLARTEIRRSIQPYFAPDGREIWDDGQQGWGIIEDSESGVTELRPLGVNARPPGTLPWRSSRGYEVTDDGWILSPAQRRLLWLPHRWRSGKEYTTWSGQFLGLSHRELPEVVILEFFD